MITFILTLSLTVFATSIDTIRAELDDLPFLYAHEIRNITDIQVNELGTNRLIYVSAGSHLYVLNGDLELEETRNLTSASVNISLSSDGRHLVVCMTDLSCEVYNTTNLSNGPVTRRPNAIVSTKNMALFTTDDRFYVGSISSNSGVQHQMFLSWYGYDSGNQGGSGTYDINKDGFERNFYGGFVERSNAYYLATDNIKPLSGDQRLRNFKVMRICNNSTGSIGALYELSLGCDGLHPGTDTRISAIAVVEDFGGISGTTIILSRSRPRSTQNFICLYSLQMIDAMMQGKFDSCSTSQNDYIKLAWRSSTTHCPTAFQVLN